jgi:hypothetical protein
MADGSVRPLSYQVRLEVFRTMGNRKDFRVVEDVP